MSSARVVVVGSGPAAAGAVLALLAAGELDILVLDIGSTLEDTKHATVTSMAERTPDAWSLAELDEISQQPVVSKDGLPQKRSFGSDYPFRDLGQLRGIDYLSGANESPISSAFGGFSNVWGAQIMPFSRSTFDTWPVRWDDIAPHYTAVLDEVPLAGEPDDLLDAFPLLSERARALPPLSGGTKRVLANYERHRDRVRVAGVTIGRARLAFQAQDCVTCGLCMTGCPYGLIYSAAQTFARLRRESRLRYESGVLVTRVGEDPDGCVVTTRSLTTGTVASVTADRVFIACGGIGSTRLALGSIRTPPRELTMSESVQFAVPFVSRRSMGDPRHDHGFTLNQFNILVGFDDVDYHTSQIHCYPYNPSILNALPGPLRKPALNPVTSQMLARLTIGLGYLPSWASPPIHVAVGAAGAGDLPALTIGAPDAASKPLMLKRVMRRLKHIAPALDLYPVESALRLSAAAKSFHFGGSFPHRHDPAAGPTGTDLLGRPPGWQRIHLVDGAVLPSVPSTTFTLTVMANAHRIATGAVRTGDGGHA